MVGPLLRPGGTGQPCHGTDRGYNQQDLLRQSFVEHSGHMAEVTYLLLKRFAEKKRFSRGVLANTARFLHFFSF